MGLFAALRRLQGTARPEPDRQRGKWRGKVNLSLKDGNNSLGVTPCSSAGAQEWQGLVARDTPGVAGLAQPPRPCRCLTG